MQQVYRTFEIDFLVSVCAILGFPFDLKESNGILVQRLIVIEGICGKRAREQSLYGSRKGLGKGLSEGPGGHGGVVMIIYGR